MKIALRGAMASRLKSLWSQATSPSICKDTIALCNGRLLSETAGMDDPVGLCLVCCGLAAIFNSGLQLSVVGMTVA